MKKIINWIKENKFEVAFLLVVVGFGAFLRFYQIREHVTFLGDEGRDALIVKRMIVDHKFTLLGPTISFGNLYLGPIYYYFMIIPLWLSRFDPVGPAIMVACFGIMSIFLVWLLGREFFNKVAAIVASSLYAVSPLVISHTRSSWNPNPMPLFALLAILGLFEAVKNKNGKWLMLTGASLGVTLQLHYIALVLIFSTPIILLFLARKINFKWYLMGILAFLAILWPQFWFEFRHGFVNTKAMVGLFLRKGEFTAAAGVGFDRLSPIALFKRLFVSLLSAKMEIIGLLLAILCIVVLAVVFFKEKNLRTKNLGLSVLMLWVFFGILGVSLYRGPIHDHYLGFLFPSPFLFLGFVTGKIWSNKWGKFFTVVLVMGLLLFNVSKTNAFSKVGPNYQIERVQLVSKTIADDVGNQRFNIALVSPTKDFFAYNYRYFLELYGKVPEPYDNFNNIDVLYVIEETKWVSPDQLDLWEVGTFGPFVASRDWTFDFQVVIYRLEHQK